MTKLRRKTSSTVVVPTEVERKQFVIRNNNYKLKLQRTFRRELKLYFIFITTIINK